MSVTAYPVILVDSTNGAASDTACSGAGPTTALTGTLGATDGGGTTVTLADSPDLTNVATDGSHVIYVADTTTGHRRFSAINGKGNSGGPTAFVTVEQAFTGSLAAKAWAIGGVRASAFGSVSKLLIDNNTGNGDAMSGWAIEMQSAHAETVAATVKCFRAGDVTNGRITLRGVAGAATLPLLTFSNNGIAIQPSGAYWTFQDFEMQNSNATKTASYGIANTGTTSDALLIQGVKIAHSTNKFYIGINNNTDNNYIVRDCEIGYTANVGLQDVGGGSGALYLHNNIHHCGSHGIALQYGLGGRFVIDNTLWANTGDGINISGDSGGSGVQVYAFNTCNGNGSDGIEHAGSLASTGSISHRGTQFYNNILTNNTGYGLKFSNGSVTAQILRGWGIQVYNNDTYNNTSGAYLPSGYGTADPQVDPGYANAAGGNFSVGPAVKALGWPTIAIGKSATLSYVDPGAAQRLERPPTRQLVHQAIYGHTLW